MPTFTSPVALADLQTYLKDSSTDPTVTGFFQTCLNVATEAVYTWLDRDYTASATKTDTFWGDDTTFYAPLHQVGTLLSWTSSDRSGTVTTENIASLIVRANGYLLQALNGGFERGAEHTISYQQPASLSCPETVAQVITEIAALLFQASNQGTGSLGLLIASQNDGASIEREHFLDLSPIHQLTLRPYKRYPV
ncbi:MAG TPA: hypothetical protein VGM92_02910 [Candidatus Kapabacteria bacterium]|jgi:hypothetical protein